MHFRESVRDSIHPSTAWHTHPLGQILIVTAGCGLVQRWDGPVEEIRPGDVVWISPAFLLIEYRSKAPLMPLGFLRRSLIFGANVVGLLQVAAFVAMIFILTNYLQQVRGYSALLAGLAFIPMGIVFLVVSRFLSARLVNRFGVKLILISGMALQTIGYLFLSPISLTESYFGGLLGPMLLIGLGTGLGFTTINIAALTGTRRGEEGPIGLETLAPTGHQLVQPGAVAMVTGFGYAFLSHTANRDRNYLYGFTHTGKTSSSWSGDISDRSSELREL